MNLAYFRKSNFDFQKTLENLKEKINKNNFKILSQIDLNNKQGVVLNICNQDWISNLIASDKNFFGLMPCSIVILNRNDEIMVGVGNPNLIGKLTDNPALIDLSQKAENILKSIINESCGVGPLKVKRIKLYATMSCPYCKMEASWLDSKKVKYDHVYVDLNPIAGEEMIRKTGQMGVPVTEIVYDNNEEEYIIGFDKTRLEEILK
ncbi:MAG: hypothetical protein N2593_00560 [Patescibacteria group bacterium]|nr:hypothetical protein [Patescibacteria group bacterium]